VNLNMLFLAGAAVSGTVLTVLVAVYYRMRKTRSGSEKPESALSCQALGALKVAHEARKHEKAMTIPEATDYSEASQVTRELQSDADAVSAFSNVVSTLAKSETKKTFLAIMTQLEKQE